MLWFCLKGRIRLSNEVVAVPGVAWEEQQLQETWDHRD